MSPAILAPFGSNTSDDRSGLILLASILNIVLVSLERGHGPVIGHTNVTLLMLIGFVKSAHQNISQREKPSVRRRRSCISCCEFAAHRNVVPES